MHPLARELVDRSPTRLRSTTTLLMRTGQAVFADRVPGLAAEVAFWVLLSLPALLLTGVALTGALSGLDGTDWQTELIQRITEVASLTLTPSTVDGTLRPLLTSLLEDADLGLVSFAFVTTIWTASRAVKVVLTVLAIAYDREGHRAAWKERLLGFGVTLGGLIVAVLIAPLLIAGPDLGDQLTGWFGTDLLGFARWWRIAWWPVVVIAASTAVWGLFHLGVPDRTPWLRDLPGAVLTAGVWLAGSGGLRLYARWILGTDSVYGPLAGPIVALLWLWVTGFAVLLGAELNAQIERTWPSGEPAHHDRANPRERPREASSDPPELRT